MYTLYRKFKRIILYDVLYTRSYLFASTQQMVDPKSSTNLTYLSRQQPKLLAKKSYTMSKKTDPLQRSCKKQTITLWCNVAQHFKL